MAWVLMMGKEMGFTEKEIGHMTMFKFNECFENYKKIYNFKKSDKLYVLRDEEKSEDEWY